VSELIYNAIMFVPLSYFEMDVLKEKRVCIKFCQKLGKTATETYKMLQQAFGETALSRSKTFEWFSRFKNGRTSIDDYPHRGRPSTAQTNETVNRANAVIHGNRRLTIRVITDEQNLSFGTCQAILTQDLEMRRMSAKLVLLTQDQTEHCATACHKLLKCAEHDATFLPSIITGDESLVYGYDPETKHVVTMEDTVVTSAEESEASPVKCQDNADHFL
jgi:hypothetical protein